VPACAKAPACHSCAAGRSAKASGGQVARNDKGKRLSGKKERVRNDKQTGAQDGNTKCLQWQGKVLKMLRVTLQIDTCVGNY